MTTRALVTGASGFAGRHLASRLLQAGWVVAGTVHRQAAGVVGLEDHNVEISDKAALHDLMVSFKPEVVFHLAAVVDTVTTPDVLELHRTNTLGTASVLEAARGVRDVKRVLVASSSFAYGRTSMTAQPVHETEPLQPITPYGASKAAAEAIALQWSRETGTEVVVSRAFQHTGPGHAGRYALADWARQLAQGEPTIKVGNLEVVRDYLDVRDVAAAYHALAMQGRAGGVYNVGSGVPRSMRSILEGLIGAFGGAASIEVESSRVRAVDQEVFYADISKITADTDWSPVIDFNDTLSDLADWSRAACPDKVT